MRELQGEVIGIGLFAEVEERLRVGALLVGGGHQVRDQRLESRWIGTKDGGHLRLLHLGIHGGEEKRMKMMSGDEHARLGFLIDYERLASPLYSPSGCVSLCVFYIYCLRVW